MKGSFVFLGPSLSHADAREIFSGTILPPARRGDLAALWADGVIPDAVGLVDGTFLHEFPVTPKEVMATLATGTRLYGSSSMGALRAVECERYGMVGVGTVFDLYRTGVIDADDEVAITFDPDTLQARAEPLVNIRVAMADAAAREVLADSTAAAVLAAAKNMFFPYRTYANIAAVLRGVLSDDQHARLIGYMRDPTRPDQKRLDALKLLATMTGDGNNNNDDVSSPPPSLGLS